MNQVCVTCAGLLFDMDGVLVDSLASVRRSWWRWAAEFGVDDAATLEIPHGTRAADIILLLAPHADQKLALARIDAIEVEDVADIVVLPGVSELLQRLPEDEWAIVTSATALLLAARLKAAGLPRPKHVVTGSDVREGKPSPEPYLRGAEMLGLQAADCIVVEDAPSGVRAGKAAGARVIGVLTTHDAEALRDAGADWIIASMRSLRANTKDAGLELFIEAL